MLKKIMFRPGVNKENTRYASEALGSVNAGTEVVGGWYDSEKVRFRAGTPEKLGGWVQISANYFKGVCRSLWNWVTLTSLNLIGVGTNLKFYISNGGAYYDITPIRATTTLTNPFGTILNSSTVLVTDAAGGFADGAYVTFNGSSAIGGLTLLGEYKISLQSATTYNITAESTVSLVLSTGVFTAQFQLANNVKWCYPPRALCLQVLWQARPIMLLILQGTHSSLPPLLGARRSFRPAHSLESIRPLPKPRLPRLAGEARCTLCTKSIPALSTRWP